MVRPKTMPYPVEVCRREVTVDARQRSFIAVRGHQRGPRPALVLMLHGTMQTAANIRPFAGYSFDALAVGGQTVVLYPDAIRREWNGARKAVMASKSSKAVDDVGFICALIAYAVDTEDVDPDRVYVAGFSLGGQMTIRLIHEIPDLLAGAAVLSANMPAAGNLTLDHDVRTAVPVMLVHGTADPLAPYKGGLVDWRGHFSKGMHLSAEHTARYFARRNGITTEPTVIELPHQSDVGPPTSVTRGDYTASGAQRVRFYTVHGGGHVLNNPKRVSHQWFWGPSSRDICVADAAADFFGLPTTSFTT